VFLQDEPGTKRYRPTSLTQVVSVLSSNVSTFQLLPKLKGMALVPPPISSSSTSSEFILNDSFVRMVEEKQSLAQVLRRHSDISHKGTYSNLKILHLSLFLLYLYSHLSFFHHISI
jgi:hypothetical protein